MDLFVEVGSCYGGFFFFKDYELGKDLFFLFDIVGVWI